MKLFVMVVLRVLLPRECLSHASGFLVGFVDATRHICCATALCADQPHTGSKLTIDVIGTWKNHTADGDHSRNGLRQSAMHVHATVVRSGNVVCRAGSAWPATVDDVIVILYDARRFYTSYHLMSDRRSLDDGDGVPIAIVDVVAHSLREFCKCKPSTAWRDVTLIDFVHCRKPRWQVLLRTCTIRSLHSPAWLARVTLKICNLRFLHVVRCVTYPVLRHVNYVAAVVTQLAVKLSSVNALISASPTESLHQQFTRRTVLCRNLLDVALGLFFMMILLRGDMTQNLADLLMAWADNIVSELQNLLRWMMGVPAGLKLNSQLDRFLGRFFLYHIYLWTGYLQLLRPILSTSLWYISLAGCLGASLQICLIQDLLSMLTLHIYCFYVYAARLYHLQMCALTSLWRLFRGKKWNALRRRVDSTSYDIDQLFLGTLIFSVLLFLLPTTALFYVVFLALRLLVLAVQGILQQIVLALNIMPAYALWLRLFHPAAIADSVEMIVLPQSKDTHLCLYMKLVPTSLTRLLAGAQRDQGSAAIYTWSTFAADLLTGQLIYPWLSSSTKPSKHS